MIPFIYFTLQKEGYLCVNIWIPFGQQKRLLKVIILNILCTYGTKVLKTDDRLFKNWFGNSNLDHGYCLPHWCSLSLVSKMLETHSRLLYTSVSWGRKKMLTVRCSHLVPTAYLNQ